MEAILFKIKVFIQNYRYGKGYDLDKNMILFHAKYSAPITEYYEIVILFYREIMSGIQSGDGVSVRK